ncbi:hypothetical protein ACFVW2_32925 [Streptomyces sp. NPDC058171]
MRNPSLDQLADREFALTVSCRDCGAKVGESCTRTDFDGTKHPLENFPAHHKRIVRAARVERMQAEANQ